MTVTQVPYLTIDGAHTFVQAVRYARVRRALNSVAHLHLRLDPDDTDSAKAVVGKQVTIAVSDGTGQVGATLFDGEIVSVGVELGFPRAQLVVDAYDKGHRLMRQAPTTTHLDLQPSDIITKIARAAGLSTTVDAFGPQYKVYHQWGTAGRCLDELCRTFGAEWWVEGSQLVVRTWTSSPADSAVMLEAGENLREFSARFSAAEQVEKVSVRGWDVASKSVITGQANGVNVPLSSGPDAVTNTADRKPAQSWSRLIHDEATATDIAAGQTASAAMGVMTGRGECDVDSRIVPGKTITITGMGARWNGKYYVSGVEHVLGIDQPFITRFVIGGRDPSSLVDLLGDASQPTTSQLIHGLTIGIVTNIEEGANDTPKLNRVKVKFPYLSDADESQWARLVVAGGGKNRGLVMLPEINDEVLVGFENGDLAKPIVLGGLWNGTDTPPLLTDKPELVDAHKVASRQWISRNGHRIVLADKSGSDELIKIELADKQTFITLTKDKGISITATDQPIELTNGDRKASIKLADNGDITIKGAKITIQATGDVVVEGMNVKATGKSNMQLEGQAAFKAKGGASAALEATGPTEIKGMPVKIN